ncbi:hypothetical protein LY28_02870 [Ruminiclostridium sufflavum DSM 19573]|uniref:Uncharacterized protein n=1 Tax=Ruminiclostridium sufflavum DSM 19573 TaxID=1121337 RepID=A0A318Y3Q2_9FIRM|nr:hypothetical protein [Ruminiclostridium sufflavum]PYG86651.1 hypothetical protein LY28_02870 [Ruminiclostridium sufflavum DSM 19573]
MQPVFITEREELVNGFKVITKKPELSENEYRKIEYLIVADIFKSLSEQSYN